MNTTDRRIVQAVRDMFTCGIPQEIKDLLDLVLRQDKALHPSGCHDVAKYYEDNEEFIGPGAG